MFVVKSEKTRDRFFDDWSKWAFWMISSRKLHGEWNKQDRIWTVNITLEGVIFKMKYDPLWGSLHIWPITEAGLAGMTETVVFGMTFPEVRLYNCGVPIIDPFILQNVVDDIMIKNVMES